MNTHNPLPGAVPSLHQLIEHQVARTPELEALRFKGQSLSYAELDRRANQLAHYLRELGVGPDDIVGLYMERSLELVIALLAILTDLTPEDVQEMDLADYTQMQSSFRRLVGSGTDAVADAGAAGAVVPVSAQ